MLKNMEHTTTLFHCETYHSDNIVTGVNVPADVRLRQPAGRGCFGGAGVDIPIRQYADVTQTSNKAVINWTGFDIAPNETTQFFQPSSNAIALNRVNSSMPSQIQRQRCRLTAISSS